MIFEHVSLFVKYVFFILLIVQAFIFWYSYITTCVYILGIVKLLRILICNIWFGCLTHCSVYLDIFFFVCVSLFGSCGFWQVCLFDGRLCLFRYPICLLFFCFWLFLRLLAWVGVVGPPLDVRYMYYISLMILGVIFVDIRLWHESTYDSRHATCHYPMIESVFFIVWDYSQQSKVRLTRDSHH